MIKELILGTSEFADGPTWHVTDAALFWFLYEEMGPGVLRSHRALMRFLAVRIPKEDLLFPEAGLPEGIYQRIV